MSAVDREPMRRRPHARTERPGPRSALDLELKGWVVDFLRDNCHPSQLGISRHRVAVEFFDGRDYEAKRCLLALEDEGRVVKRRMGKWDYWAPAPPLPNSLGSRTELDPEILEWIRDFAQERKRVTVPDVRREFFPDEAGHPYLYLDWLQAEGDLRLNGRTGVYEWANHPESNGEEVPPELERKPEPTPRPKPEKVSRPRGNSSHRDCPHPATKYERQKCRYGYYKPGTMEPATTVGQILRAVKPKPAPKPKRFPKPKSEPKPPLSPAEAEAKRRRWAHDGRSLTVPRLAYLIHTRMKNDREHKGYYRFTMEWVRLHYPFLVDNDPEMVNAALQHLVDTGRISGIPK